MGLGRAGPGRAGLEVLSSDACCCCSPVRINNDLLMWEPADLLPTSTTAARPPGSSGFKMCKSAFKLGMRSTWAGWDGAVQAWRGGEGPSLHICLPSHLVHSDSDSDEEDTQFFSMASGVPQTPAPEPSRHSQSTFSTLVTVLKGRITALCEAKVRQPGAGERPTPGPLVEPHKPASFRLGGRRAESLKGQRTHCRSLPPHSDCPSTPTAPSCDPAFSL